MRKSCSSVRRVSFAPCTSTCLLYTSERVQIPLNLLDHFPHELDGGMRQIVGIARALSLNADFIVCDEPVSSLDVSI